MNPAINVTTPIAVVMANLPQSEPSLIAPVLYMIISLIRCRTALADQHVWFVQLDRMSDNRFPDMYSRQKIESGRGFSRPRQACPENGRIPLANVLSC